LVLIFKIYNHSSIKQTQSRRPSSRELSHGMLHGQIQHSNFSGLDISLLASPFVDIAVLCLE